MITYNRRVEAMRIDAKGKVTSHPSNSKNLKSQKVKKVKKAKKEVKKSQEIKKKIKKNVTSAFFPSDRLGSRVEWVVYKSI